MADRFRKTLLATYGPLMDAKAICRVLCYPSVAALLAARARGRIAFPLLELKGRRGFFASTEDIAAYLQGAHDDATATVPTPGYATATLEA